MESRRQLSSSERLHCSTPDCLRPKRAELQRALEEQQARAIFRRKLSPCSMTHPAKDAETDAASAGTDRPAHSGKGLAGNADTVLRQRKVRGMRRSACFPSAAASSQGPSTAGFCAYSPAIFKCAEVVAKLAVNAATEAEGLYWETSSREARDQALARASQLDSNSPKFHVLLGDIYRQRKYFPDAEQEYRKALALNAEDTGALFGLSLTLLAIQIWMRHCA